MASPGHSESIPQHMYTLSWKESISSHHFFQRKSSFITHHDSEVQSSFKTVTWNSPQQVNSLGPSDVIWRHKSGLTLAQVMLVAWRHQAITWTNVDISLRSNGIHLRAILQEIPQPSVTAISLKITYLKFCSNLSGANELIISLLSHLGLTSHCPTYTPIKSHNQLHQPDNTSHDMNKYNGSIYESQTGYHFSIHGPVSIQRLPFQV